MVWLDVFIWPFLLIPEGCSRIWSISLLSICNPSIKLYTHGTELVFFSLCFWKKKSWRFYTVHCTFECNHFHFSFLVFLFTPYFHTIFSAPLTPAGGMRFILCVRSCRARSLPATKRTLERPSIAPTLQPFTYSVSTMPNRWVLTAVGCKLVSIRVTRMSIRHTVNAKCENIDHVAFFSSAKN